jgi:membrane protease YdiL (CAAX protease family)
MNNTSHQSAKRQVAPVVYALLGLMLLALVAGAFLKGEVAEFCRQSWDATMMALIGVLAYLGLNSRIARMAAWLLLGVLLLICVIVNTAMGAMIVAAGRGLRNIPPHSLAAGDKHLLASILTVSVMAALTALLPLSHKVRSLGSVLTGNREWTSVRVLALGGVFAISLILLVPLVMLGQPPMSEMLEKDGGFAKMLSAIGNNPSGALRGDLYDLCWSLLAAPLAVGFGVRRNWKECLDRLGMVRLSPRQIGAAIGLTALVYALFHGTDSAISHLWGFFHWPTTDEKYYEALFKSTNSPVGAVVVGVTAGFGEELLARGVLLPRLGILLSSVFFAAMHAYQYSWDALMSVFLFGVMLGVIRKKSSTSVCVIVHGGYDFVLCLIDFLSK